MKLKELRKLIREEIEKIEEITPPAPQVNNHGFVNFLNKIIKNIFTSGIKDPMVQDIDGWDVLFEYWNIFGDLQLHTQSDIIGLAKECGVSQEDINYIMDLPEVSDLERG